ncbi:hypothetical protein LIER_27197 [Lithospermum erythrorhizon]|uniref:Transposase n=1 Tax=Lithospermum erythrorhizon TaxID=34254 RepID=A0AAV3RCE0_LITER
MMRFIDLVELDFFNMSDMNYIAVGDDVELAPKVGEDVESAPKLGCMLMLPWIVNEDGNVNQPVFMEDVCDDEQTNNEVQVEQPSIVSLAQIEQPSIVLEAQVHEPIITKHNIVDRKGKGKVVVPEVRKKRIRFTHKTTVEESMDDVVDGEQSQSQTQLPELDDNGDLVQLQADPDLLYGMFVDGFDNNDPGDDNNANNKSDEIVDNNDEVPIRGTSGRKREACTYARYDKDFREMKAQGYGDSNADSDSVENLLNDNACNSDIESPPSSSDEESPREKNIRCNGRFIQGVAEVKIPTLQVCVHKKYGIKISPNTARRMKEMAMKKINEDHVKELKKIWDYSHELYRSHPGSTVLIEYEEPSGVFEANRFQRMYICLKPLVDGFNIGCRNLIGLDKCHSKGMYKHQILTIVALDHNNGRWPKLGQWLNKKTKTVGGGSLDFLYKI